MPEPLFDEDGKMSDEMRAAFWRTPLPQFASMIGLPVSKAQALILENWAARLAVHVAECAVKAERAKVRDWVSRN